MFATRALSLPLTAPVPEEFAAPLDSKQPTTYGSYQVATGPYMLKADPAGSSSESTTSRASPRPLCATRIGMPAHDPRPAYLDQINIKIGGDPNVIGRQVLTGHTLQNDIPPARSSSWPTSSTTASLSRSPAPAPLVSLNNKQGPFTNVNARKALWAALDREAMIKARRQIVAQLGTHFIYPGSAATTGRWGHGPNVDYNSYPPATRRWRRST